MNTLDRYLFKSVLSMVVLVAFVLLSLAAFVDFMREVDDVGKGGYGVGQALIFVALGLPQKGFELLPAASLLGTLLGLGNLAAHSELVVMRAAGVSVVRLGRALLVVGAALMALAVLLAEYLAPPAERYARQYRISHIDEELSALGGESLWAKDGDSIINVDQLLREDRVDGVYLFVLDSERRLERIGRADSAVFSPDDRVQLDNYRATVFAEGGLTAVAEQRLDVPSSVNPELLALSIVDPDSLTSAGLFRYGAHLQRNGLNYFRYQVAFWQRFATILSVSFMVLVSLPFVFGAMRSAGTGARLVIGVLIGLGYNLASRTLASSGEVFGLEPMLTAMLPLAAIGLITVIGIARIR